MAIAVVVEPFVELLLSLTGVMRIAKAAFHPVDTVFDVPELFVVLLWERVGKMASVDDWLGLRYDRKQASQTSARPLFDLELEAAGFYC